jgi:hypothetical protein
LLSCTRVSAHLGKCEGTYGAHCGPLGAQHLADLTCAQRGVVCGNLGATAARKDHKRVHGPAGGAVGIESLGDERIVVCGMSERAGVQHTQLTAGVVVRVVWGVRGDVGGSERAQCDRRHGYQSLLCGGRMEERMQEQVFKRIEKRCFRRVALSDVPVPEVGRAKRTPADRRRSALILPSDRPKLSPAALPPRLIELLQSSLAPCVISVASIRFIRSL